MAEYIDAWLAGPNATQFYTRTYPAASPKAAVVFLHGFAEHIGRYTHVHPLLAQNGISVFTFDLRGFGRTAQDSEKKSRDSAYGKTNWPDNFADIEWAIGHAKKEFPGVPIFLMGHSMGGALALGFVTRGAAPPSVEVVESLAGVICQSPLIHQTFPASKVLRWAGGKASSLLPYTLIPAPVKPEVFFVHGTEDKVTCPKASKAFFEKISTPVKEYETVEGGFHELQNEPNGVKEKVYDMIITFISSRVAPPSKL
ncbi:hypothetical protein ONZ45_g2970 [Pleurotus djamor]|nr:hypothetical protein ONZ45_g2970 [Pleurotus djamor]